MFSQELTNMPLARQYKDINKAEEMTSSHYGIV